MTIQEYARAVAEAVWHHARTFEVPDPPLWEELDAIIASVPPPAAQHHDAPTCDGWWWARHSFNRRWEAVLYVYDGNQEEPEQYVVLNGQEEGRDVSEFDAWVGPLLPPDTTEPAPRCARLPEGSGAAVVSFPLPDNHWLTAEHENVPPMPFRMGTDDPRRTEWKNAIRDAGKYAVRCATMNGADNDFDPDALVQNLVVGMIGYFTPDGFSSDAWANPEQPTPAILTDTDAAVAREREEVQAHAPLYLEWVKEGALSADDALERLVIWLRARSAKGE